MDPYCLAGKALHRIVLRKNGRVFGDECVIPTWLVKVVGYAACRGEGKERVEQWADGLEVQELGEEGKGLWVRQSDWHDGDLVRGFGGCRQRRGGWKYGEVSAVEREY